MNSRGTFRILVLVAVGFKTLAAREAAPAPSPAPPVEPDRIVNDSYAFLKDREPSMTEVEHALYEKVVPMVKTQPALALNLLEQMVAAEGTSPAFDFVLGNLYYEQKRVPEAEARYRRAVEKFPTFIRAWDNLGVLLYSDGRFAEAVPCFSKVLALGDWQARNLGLLAYCLSRSDNPIAAEMAYMQAYTIEPENAEWIEGLLSTYLDTEQYSRAESLLRQLIKLKPKEIHYWRLLVRSLVAQDRKLDAIAALEVAEALGTLDDDGMLLLGDLYAEQKLPAEAVQAYHNLAARSASLGAGRLLRYARALIAENALPEAEKTLAALPTPLPAENRVAFFEATAELARARGDDGKEGKAWSDLVALDPLNGRAQLEFADFLMRTGDEDRAVFSLEAATRDPASAFAANLQLANVNVRNRHFQEALVFIEKAMTLNKTPELQDFEARVKALVERRE